MVFTLTIEAGLRAYDRGWDRQGIRLVVFGTVVFAAILTSYRYLSLEMAAHPWVFGPLIMLSMASVIFGYVRTTRRWERAAVPVHLPEQRREPQPELV